MLFSSISFLYYFLPTVFLVYLVVPRKFKNFILVVASLIFYAWGEPAYCLLIVYSIIQAYVIGRLIEGAQDQKKAKRFLLCSTVFNIGLLASLKYSDFFIENVNAVTSSEIPLFDIVLPLGISIYTFQLLSYNIDVYRKAVSAEKNLISFMTYATLFPQLVAGPMIRYIDIAKQIKERTHSIPRVYLGGRRFLIGMGKTVLIANTFGTLCSKFMETEQVSVLYYWLYALSFTLQIYYYFSGYSDMAIGLGKIFGFDYLENFHYPYIAKSITEFWRRWHISLSSWFRDYVYIPLGGNRVSKIRLVLNILVVSMLTGFWHGGAWNYIIWGLYFAVLLLFEKFFFLRILEGMEQSILGRICSHIYVMFLVVLSFVFFNAKDVSQGICDVKCLIGLGHIPLISMEGVYYLRSYAIVLIVSILGVTPLVKWVGTRMEKNKRIAPLLMVIEPLAFTLLLLVITGYLLDGSFNPFLYFRL